MGYTQGWTIVDMTNPDELKYLNVEELQPAAEGAEDTPGSKTTAAKQVKRGSRKVADTATSVGHGASRTASDVTHATAERVKTGSRTAWDATTSVATTLMSTTQSLLTLRLSEGLNDLLQNLVKGSESIYDKAMVAEDLAAQAGSSAYHRLFDGGHTILGAGRAAGGASPEDSIVREGLGTVQGLLRGVTDPSGILHRPSHGELGQCNLRQGGRRAGVGLHPYIPKGWFYDLNTYDAAELLGGAVGAVALTFSWNRAQTATFARLVGGMGLSAAISANPLLLIVTVVSLAKAFHKAHETGEYAELIDGQLRGGVGAGATLSAVALVGAASGPAGVALLAGLTAGILASRATKRVSVTQISHYLAGKTTVVAAEAKTMIAQESGDSSDYVFLDPLGRPRPASQSRGTAGPPPRSRSYSSRPPRSLPTPRTRPGALPPRRA